MEINAQTEKGKFRLKFKKKMFKMFLLILNTIYIIFLFSFILCQSYSFYFLIYFFSNSNFLIYFRFWDSFRTVKCFQSRSPIFVSNQLGQLVAAHIYIHSALSHRGFSLTLTTTVF